MKRDRNSVLLFSQMSSAEITMLHSAFTISCRVLVMSLLWVGFCAAQTTTLLAPLGLPRLKEQAKPGEAAPLARTKFADTDLTKGSAGVRAGEKRGAKFLTLDARKDWSQPLRGKPGDVLFVSFSVNGSPGTVIEIGGARLIVAESAITNYATLVLDESTAAGVNWRELGLHSPLEKYDTRPLASFSVLTLRLDPANSAFDLYLGTQLITEDLPYQSGKDNRRLTLLAGEAGAMLNGLVQSDENPLYDDANANGIDDRYEQQKQGRLLAANASKAERQALIKDWRDSQRTARPAALFVHLPRPDGR